RVRSTIGSACCARPGPSSRRSTAPWRGPPNRSPPAWVGGGGTPPTARVVDEGGVEHRVWAIPARTDVGGWLAELPMLIADGHHRYETALAYRDERRRGEGPGPGDGVVALVVDAAHETFPVLPH